jgi:hypothetical protein
VKSFKHLAGVPVHYDRDRPQDYGTKGRQLTYEAQPDFIDRLDSAFEELWTVFGKADIILTAGAYVDKPGWHGRGLAFDLDGILWPDKTMIAGSYPNHPRLYLGIEAVLRRHMGTVLDWYYNKAHRDHWHMQWDGRQEFLGASSQTYFLQAALTYVFGEVVAIDGVYGPHTRDALSRALDYVDLDGGHIWGKQGLQTWFTFLARTAKWGLK